MKKCFVLAGLCIFLVPVTSATIILSSGSLPQNQGWDSHSDGVSSVTADATAIRINTCYPDNAGGTSPVLLFYRTIGDSSLTKFTLEISMKVNESNYNNYDGGVALLGSYSGNFGLPDERSQMIIFGEDRIRWGEPSNEYFIDTTDEYHTYVLDVDLATSTANFYVDGVLALTRSDYFSNGVIAFGDESNDGALNMEGSGSVNGDFSVAYIDLVVPEPCTLVLFGLGGYILARKRIY